MRPFYEEQQSVLLEKLEKKKRVYIAKSNDLAIGQFQKDIQSILSRIGVALVSMQVEKKEEKSTHGYTPAKVKLRLRGDNEQVAILIHALESRAPLGFIDSLTIRRQGGNIRSGKALLDISILYTVYIGRSA